MEPLPSTAISAATGMIPIKRFDVAAIRLNQQNLLGRIQMMDKCMDQISSTLKNLHQKADEQIAWLREEMNSVEVELPNV